MNRPSHVGYVLLGVLLLVPVGLRAITWERWRPKPVDPAMAQQGETLFKHDWVKGDPRSPGGDGLGPVFNATSCVACHHQGGTGGGGGLKHNVTTFTSRFSVTGAPREGVVHARAVPGCPPETLQNVHPNLPPVSQPSLRSLVPSLTRSGHQHEMIAMPHGVHVSQRNTPALFGAKLIDEIPERDIIANERAQKLKWGLAPSDTEDKPVGRALRLKDGRVGRFGWKAQSPNLAAFVQAACANELGLGNPGQAQPAPLGKANYRPPGHDLTLEQCDQITSFIAALPPPVERLPDDAFGRSQATAGKKLFHSVGCADCHTPDVGPAEGVYSDLLLHRMGVDLVGGGSYNEPAPIPTEPDGKKGDAPSPGEWRTPPLWGVADSAPYLHDGRAQTLPDAIAKHGGQGARSAQRFARLNPGEQEELLAFLKTLRAP